MKETNSWMVFLGHSSSHSLTIEPAPLNALRASLPASSRVFLLVWFFFFFFSRADEVLKTAAVSEMCQQQHADFQGASACEHECKSKPPVRKNVRCHRLGIYTTVDGQNPAPPKKPRNDDSPANTNKKCFPWFKVVQDFVHPQ